MRMAHNLSPQFVPQPTHDESPALHRNALARQVLARRILVGGFLGLAWGASLRAWMTLLALELGDRPRLTWSGSFGAILLPAAVVGALVGAAVYAAETSDSKRWRWVILAPLLLALTAAVATENFLTLLLTSGIGGGAIGVALIGVLGGYALSGFGPSWLRWVSGALAAVFTVALVYPLYFAGSAPADTLSASKVFGALLFALLMILLIVGVSAPARYRSGQRYVGLSGADARSS
jgi:hypothetical protein